MTTRVSRTRSFDAVATFWASLWVITAMAAVVVAGWAAVRYGGKAVIAVGVLTIAASILHKRAFGVMIGIAVLADLNGIPGGNVNPAGNAISHLQDLATLALLGGAGYVALSGKVAHRSSIQRALYLAGGLLAAWWILTWARTVMLHGIPAILAARFARDYLFFALALPLLCDVFVTYPRIRRQAIWTIGSGAFVYAVAQIVQSRSHVSLDVVLHAEHYTVIEGTTRVYSPMNAAVRAGFALSCGALVLASHRRSRYAAAIAALVFGVAMLLQLTRAAYFGALVGFLLAGAIWWFRRSAFRETARARLLFVPILAAIVVAFGAAVSGAERHLISTVTTRALAGYSDVNSTGGTVAVRVDTGKEMLRLLGVSWPIGLGFIHPAVKPFPALPNGSIRNPDLGLLNPIMLMGVFGAILVYLPLILVLRRLGRSSESPQDTDRSDEWIRLGTAIWIIGAIASSLTLVDLFNFGGLMLSACVLALAASVTVRPESPDLVA